MSSTISEGPGLSDDKSGYTPLFTTARLLVAVLAVAYVVTLVLQSYGVGDSGYRFNLNTVGSDTGEVSSFLGIAICYSLLKVSRLEQVIVSAGGMLLEAMVWAIRPENWSWNDCLGSAGFGLGIACLVGLGWHARDVDVSIRTKARGLLCVSGFLLLFPSVTYWCHFFVRDITPELYDLFALQVDGLWRNLPLVPESWFPGQAVAAMVQSHWWLLSIIQLVYCELTVILVVALFLAAEHYERCYNQVIWAFAGMGLGGFLLYLLYPAVGLGYLSEWVFPAGDYTLWAADPYIVESYGVRNCMPSLHMAWILCVYFGVKRISPTVKWVSGLLVLITILATLTMCHYLVDLVMSFPLVLVFQSLTAKSQVSVRRRWVALLVGLALLLGGLISLRFGHAWLVAHWQLTLLGQVLIVGVSAAGEQYLASSYSFAGESTQLVDSPAHVASCMAGGGRGKLIGERTQAYRRS